MALHETEHKVDFFATCPLVLVLDGQLSTFLEVAVGYLGHVPQGLVWSTDYSVMMHPV